MSLLHETELFNSFFTKIKKANQIANNKLPYVLETLAKNGWYYDLNMPFSWIFKLKKDLKYENLRDEDKIKLIEELFKNYFDENINNIKNNVISKYENREHILKEAFEAHEQGKYNLSIPIFIIQADGIFKEITSTNFFIKGKRKSIDNFIRENNSSGFSKAFLESLKKITPINISTNEKTKILNRPNISTNEKTKILNRHFILHGNSLKYGTKINSLKSISLLNFIVSVGEIL